jgi:GNAT superfamily N-acetyltransferase
VRIVQFNATSDSQRLRACYDMTSAGWPVDHPGQPAWAFDSFAGKWGPGFDGAPRETWLAANDADEPVGCYLLQLPAKENAAMAFCKVLVAPHARRSGTGRALLEHCAAQARKAGRSRLVGNARDDTPGAAFAAAAGARGGIPEVYRVLTFDSALPARLAGLRPAAERRAAGYSLVSWLSPAPAEYLDQLCRIHSAMADAPRDAGVEPLVWDADRIRRSEEVMAEHKLTCYAIAARHDATGELAALTEMCIEADTPDWAFQQITAVLPEHRGHRLGLLLKIAMLEWLQEREPAVRHIETGNAGANAHMIAINEQLGFTIEGVSRDWELDLGSRQDTAAAESAPAESALADTAPADAGPEAPAGSARRRQS